MNETHEREVNRVTFTIQTVEGKTGHSEIKVSTFGLVSPAFTVLHLEQERSLGLEKKQYSSS